ncbi:MAG: hypothetical protein KJ064_19040 [Anaerolineae bacterium]|nr:hypothetical protein [Anaerolineae bacterium]
MKAKLLVFLLSLLFCFSLLEVYLRIADPWGLSYVHDIDNFYGYYDTQTYAPDWVITPGQYEYTGSSMSVLADHTRLVPDTNQTANCTVVAIGDSVTFGMWVDDEATWVNQLARNFLEVHFVNAGIPGYESQHIRRMQRRFPDADGYIYLIVRNDVSKEGFSYKTIAPNSIEFYLTAYFKVAINRALGTEEVYDWPRFWEDIAAIKASGNTLIFTYDDKVSHKIVEHDPEIIPLAWKVEPLSVVDGHPTAASHQEAAELMQPYVAAFLENVCHLE